jgi:hypothetical protein
MTLETVRRAVGAVADALRQTSDGGVVEVTGLREPIERQVIEICSTCAELSDYGEALRAAVLGEPRRAECHQRLAEAWHHLNEAYEATGLHLADVKRQLLRELEAER